MNNTNITYYNSIAITTYTNNIANDTDITDITYNTVDTPDLQNLNLENNIIVIKCMNNVYSTGL